MPWTRGWRFEGLGTVGAGAGPAITPSGGIAMVEDDASVRQSLMVLLSTVPGERVMRPDYGCPLHRLVFEQNDDTTAGLAIHYVRQAILRFEGRVEIVRLDARRAPDDGGQQGRDNCLVVSLDYRVRASQRDGRLSFDVDLGAGPP